MRWAMFPNAEYVNMIALSALAATLFLGGWHGPLARLARAVWLLLKLALFLFVFIWLRATFPRLRYDQLMASAGRCCCRSRPSTPSSPRSLVVAL